MRPSFIFFIAVVVSQLVVGCKNSPTSPGSLENLQLTFLQGSIGADLMPAVEPDPVSCYLQLLARNTSQTETLANVEIVQAEVFLKSSGEKIGSFSLSTTWDGNLAPGEQDTVVLLKSPSVKVPFQSPCYQGVYLNLEVRSDLSAFTTFKIDSLIFGCVY